MSTLAIALCICAFIFSGIAMAAAAVTAVIVIGWKNSTHKVIQMPVEPTKYEWDMPIQDPNDPEFKSQEQQLRQAQREAAALEDIYEGL